MYETQQQMKDEGFLFANATEAKLPPYNTRIVLAPAGKNADRPFEEEDASGDEAADDFKSYRDQIKQASKQIVDAKTKRHTVKKKK
jgi:hypothetical protein